MISIRADKLKWKVRIYSTLWLFYFFTPMKRKIRPSISPWKVKRDFHFASHKKCRNPAKGKWAVYLFIDSRNNRVLKCGKTASWTVGRIGQHYTSARGETSSLTRSMIQDTQNYRGITKAKSEDYIQKHFHLIMLQIEPEKDERVLNALERFCQVRLNPLYDG